MNRNNLYRKFENTFNREFIDEVIEKFIFTKNQLFEDRNLESVIDRYLSFESEKIRNQKRINDTQNEINRLRNGQKELLNYSVIKLRKENKLVSWLKNLDVRILYKLNNLLDIRNEFELVDNFKFNESKKERGIRM
jgi:hypothetical protein